MERTSAAHLGGAGGGWGWGVGVGWSVLPRLTCALTISRGCGVGHGGTIDAIRVTPNLVDLTRRSTLQVGLVVLILGGAILYLELCFSLLSGLDDDELAVGVARKDSLRTVLVIANQTLLH